MLILLKKDTHGHFGYKAHIGVDSQTGLVHIVKTTSANLHDVVVIHELLTGEENLVYGDSGYLGANKRENAVVKNKNGKKITYKINRCPSQIKNYQRENNIKQINQNTKNHPYVQRLSMYLE